MNVVTKLREVRAYRAKRKQFVQTVLALPEGAPFCGTAIGNSLVQTCAEDYYALLANNRLTNRPKFYTQADMVAYMYRR